MTIAYDIYLWAFFFIEVKEELKDDLEGDDTPRRGIAERAQSDGGTRLCLNEVLERVVC